VARLARLVDLNRRRASTPGQSQRWRRTRKARQAAGTSFRSLSYDALADELGNLDEGLAWQTMESARVVLNDAMAAPTVGGRGGGGEPGIAPRCYPALGLRLGSEFTASTSSSRVSVSSTSTDFLALPH
jgi:hypothetical protein